MNNAYQEFFRKALSMFEPARHFRGDIAWQNLTTFGIGGTLEMLFLPTNEHELHNMLALCESYHIPVFVLGNGSNVIGSDKTLYQGAVLKLAGANFERIERISPHTYRVGAGCSLHHLIQSGRDGHYKAVPELFGIPGSIGGAVAMNASAHGVCISDSLEYIELFSSSGEQFTLTRSDIHFSYRHAALPPGAVITGAVFRFEQCSESEINSRIEAAREYRRLHQPAARSAGCVFKNPCESVSAGQLIDRCGFKDTLRGGVRISREHANFFVNENNASEQDLLTLMQEVQHAVFAQTGFVLKPEIQFYNLEHQRALENGIHPLNVSVLYGGASSERDISIRSGTAVAQALTEAGFNVTCADITAPEVPACAKEADVVFPVLHGGFGEDGTLQKVLEDNDIAYVGNDSACCHVLMDKNLTKAQLKEAAISVPESVLIHRGETAIPDTLSLPLVLKVPTEGSSFGIGFAHTPEEWDCEFKKLFALSEVLLVERLIKGRECTVPVFNGRALPIIELRYPGEYYDFDAKYTYKQGATQYLCPPPEMDVALQNTIRALAERCYTACKCRDIVRFDFIIENETQTPYVLEGNAIPGFTAQSLVPKSAKVDGISFPELTARLVMLAYRRKHA